VYLNPLLDVLWKNCPPFFTNWCVFKENTLPTINFVLF
jgi:hypothetical protein